MNYKFEVGQKVFQVLDENKVEYNILDRMKTNHHGNIYRLFDGDFAWNGWQYETLLQKKNKIEVEIYE